MKDISQMFFSYICERKKHSNSYVVGKMEEAYRQGATDALEEISRFASNTMPPYYKRLLEVRIEKMKEL